MRSAALAALVVTAGCRTLLGIEDVEIARDAATDVAPMPQDFSPPDAASCYGALHTVCLVQPPTDTLMLTTQLTILNTNSDPLCNLYVPVGAGINACVVVVRSFTIDANAKLRVIGSSPLIVISTSSIRIDGTLDLSGGAGSALCQSGTPPLSGGGAGGTLGSAGGSGGGPNGGPPMAPTTKAALFGGCSGQSSTTATGGAGGGSALLIATDFQLLGKINASGFGGDGGVQAGVNGSGGGGGGSGGMVVVEAPTIKLEAGSVIMANGGGGGGGGSMLGSGQQGQSSNLAMPTNPAMGGTASSGGGTGGAGSTAGAGAPGATGSSGGGGGGGGGGAGILWLRGTTLVQVGVTSPAPT